jgi:cysteine desulfurase
VAGIAGFGAAARAAARDLAETARIRALRDRLEAGVRRMTPQAVVIGEKAPRLANTSCLAWPGKLAETLVIKFDLAGVALSAGAACSSGKVGPSHVLASMGLPAEIARSAIRISIGAETIEADIAAFLDTWNAIVGETQIAA